MRKTNQTLIHYLFLFAEDDLLAKDFITAVSRDSILLFKIDFVTSSFDGLEKSCYVYDKQNKINFKYSKTMPENFKISEAVLLESKFVLPETKPIEPYIDTLKKSIKI